MKTKQAKYPTEKAAQLCLPYSPRSVFSIQLSDSHGFLQFHNVFLYYTGNLPNILEFSRDFKTLEMYSFLTKDHTNRVVWEFNYECSLYPDYADNMTIEHGYSAILYDSGEMIVAYSNRVSYFYIKEELFSREKLREISLGFLRPKTAQEFNKLYIMKKDKDWGNRFYPYSSSNEDNFSFDHYNSDFEEFDGTLNAFLESEETGLVLLHGEVGSGKTHYLRHLINTLEQKILFIPTGMAKELCDPEFIDVLEEYCGSILIIEDAEEIMFSRECATSNSAVANLLNLTDGLMADVLQLRIICTFNIDFKKIDSALLRKGRLKASYEFKKLETERANALAKKLGCEQEITSPMVLADVFAL